MKQVWQDQARRIDALNLRERVMMFLSIALAVGALGDAFVLSPAMAERRQLTAQSLQQTKQIDALRTQLALRNRVDDTPQARAGEGLGGLRSELGSLDEQIRAQLAGREEMARLPAVLDRLLRRHDRLTLVRLSTAAPSRGATPALAQPADPLPAVRWQGVELSVSGRYPDLVSYLAELEQAMPGLRWGPLQIATPTLPPVLTVQLMLAGEAP